MRYFNSFFENYFEAISFWAASNAAIFLSSIWGNCEYMESTINQQGNEKRRVMTIQEVSTFLRLPLSTVYLLAKKGKLKGAKFGRHWRFDEQDILNYLHGGYTHAA